MKVKKYEVITATNLVDLNLDVNKRIQNGWQPFGGVCRNYIDKSDGADYQESEYAQAMVMYEQL